MLLKDEDDPGGKTRHLLGTELVLSATLEWTPGNEVRTMCHHTPDVPAFVPTTPASRFSIYPATNTFLRHVH